MSTPKPSTAAGVAWLRAAHQLIDQPPLILEDPAAVALIGNAGTERLRSDAAQLQSPAMRALRSHVVLRSRFAEDRLEAAVARGIRQYVILGAGYDTFIVRQPAWARQLRIFEVDRPSTQSEKRARLSAVGLDAPGNVTFADVDFEKESLEEGLRRHGVDLQAPTFFSWLGVMVYLTEPAIDAVFRLVASCPEGSEIVFTFSPPRRQREDGIPGLAERAAELGEPWLSHFEPEQIERKLLGFGFREVLFLTPAEAEERYFSGRGDGLPPPRRINIAAAAV
ncbi:MAG TPA: SAM-dependent methyltransferase [Gemmatimonadales bacterium]|nr:SAM-dependent methyltransferase [Gemmatimonadales bacterium]